MWYGRLHACSGPCNIDVNPTYNVMWQGCIILHRIQYHMQNHCLCCICFIASHDIVRHYYNIVCHILLYCIPYLQHSMLTFNIMLINVPEAMRLEWNKLLKKTLFLVRSSQIDNPLNFWVARLNSKQSAVLVLPGNLWSLLGLKLFGVLAVACPPNSRGYQAFSSHQGLLSIKRDVTVPQ